MKVTNTQKLSLTVTTIFLMFILAVHFSPAALVNWGWSLNSPDFFTIFGNNPVYSMSPIFDISFPSYLLIVLCVFCYGIIFLVSNENVKKFQERNNSDGFTLMELMVVVAIIGIMAAIGGLTFDFDRMHQRAAARDLYSTIQLGRSLAVKSNQLVYMGVNSDSATLYINNVAKHTITFKNNINVTDTGIAGGRLGGSPRPVVIPNSVMTACAGVPSGGHCQAMVDWIDSFGGTEYDGITTFNSRGMVGVGDGTFNISYGNRVIPLVVSSTGNARINDVYTN